MSEFIIAPMASRAKLFTALAKAQGAMEDALKDATNAHFKSKYATLAGVRDAVRKPLADNGLSVIQLPSTDGNRVTVRTILAHESGESIETEMSLTVSGSNPAHAMGSAITYMRRFSLMAITGVAADDDDGNGVEAAQATRKEAASDLQAVAEWRAKIDAANDADTLKTVIGPAIAETIKANAINARDAGAIRQYYAARLQLMRDEASS